MSENVPILKDEDRELPVPSEWRKTLRDVVEYLKEGRQDTKLGIPGVRDVSRRDLDGIYANIKAYGATLSSLPEESWMTSVCQWMRDSWLILVDLHTVEEGASDLVLFVKAIEEGQSYRFEIDSVHVP